MTIPIKVNSPDDYRDGTKQPKLIEKKIWLVNLEIPKYLINDIRTGSLELEDQMIDLDDLDSAYESDLNLDSAPGQV